MKTKDSKLHQLTIKIIRVGESVVDSWRVGKQIWSFQKRSRMAGNTWDLKVIFFKQ